MPGILFDRPSLIDLVFGRGHGDVADAVRGSDYPAGLESSYANEGGSIRRLLPNPPTAMPDVEQQPEPQIVERSIADSLEAQRLSTLAGESAIFG